MVCSCVKNLENVLEAFKFEEQMIKQQQNLNNKAMNKTITQWTNMKQINKLSHYQPK